MTIDSFASTPQYVSDSLYNGDTGPSSESTTAAIGGNRDLYVQFTTAGGGMTWARTPIGPACWTSAHSGSNGTYRSTGTAATLATWPVERERPGRA